uniref:Nudix hydrolase domain-containing protein n=1 Tax=Panagrolaimus sp. ES5 TaxID=591445 RepID=A0AC34G1U8_9BILA
MTEDKTIDELSAELYNSVKGCEQKETIYSNLLHLHPPEIAGTAAVLMVLDYRDNDWHVLLNVRSLNLRRHPGEVCFPGGMREIDDLTCIDTALREAYEEIGLPSTSVRIITTFRPFISRHLIMLYPVLAQQTSPFTPFTGAEVDKVFYAPLKTFIEAEKHSSFFYLENFQLHSFELESNTYGLTAFICIVVAMCVYNKFPEFEMTILKDFSKSARDTVNDIAEKVSQIKPALIPHEQKTASRL